jgi:hypothetical protein
VYIERERIRERAPAPSPPTREEYETFRYVPGVGSRELRSESAGYEDEGRRETKRVVERERVRAVDEGGRRRDYDRRY